MRLFAVCYCLFFALLLCCPLASNAQSTELKGTLIDSITGVPLEYGSIAVQQKDLVASPNGNLSNENGEFVIKNLKKNVYLVTIQYVGYKKKAFEIEIKGDQKLMDLGGISLAPLSQLLESIHVIGERSKQLIELEKQVFKTEQFEIAKGGTATDLIRNLPSISVNIEGQISYRGSSGFLLLINGKPIQGDINTILGQLPANSIENVELITAPSAKYDADGKAGIINIITKKGATDGLSISANFQYGLPRIKAYENATEPNRAGVDGMISFRKSKIDLTLSGSYLQNDIAGRREGEVYTIINDVKTTFPSVGERSFQRHTYSIRGLANYNPNANNEFSAGIYQGQRYQFRVADIVYTNNKRLVSTNKLISSNNYFNSNHVTKKGIFTVGNFDYKHSFANTSSLNFSALFENAILESLTENRNYSNVQKELLEQYTLNTGDSPIKAFRLKLDYEKDISLGKWTTGYQFRNQNQTGAFLYQQQTERALITVPEFSADIEIKNIIHGVYSQVSGKKQQLEYVFGIRYENALRTFEDYKGGAVKELRLSNLFPSANLLYSLNNDWKLKAGYSRRVQRSTNNELNPYPEREHSETLEQGDPNILPEFIGLYEVGISKDMSKGSIYANTYFQNIDNIVNRVNSVYNDTILNRIFTNAGHAYQLGLETGLNLSPLKWYKIYVGGNVFQLKIQGDLFDKTVAVNNKGIVYSINTTHTFNLGKTLSLQMSVNYLSQRITAQGVDSRYLIPNLSLKKTWPGEKVTTGFLWQNVSIFGMPTNEQRITTSGANFYTTTNYIQETNILMFNLSYAFNQSAKKAKLPSSEFGEREF